MNFFSTSKTDEADDTSGIFAPPTKQQEDPPSAHIEDLCFHRKEDDMTDEELHCQSKSEMVLVTNTFPPEALRRSFSDSDLQLLSIKDDDDDDDVDDVDLSLDPSDVDSLLYREQGEDGEDGEDEEDVSATGPPQLLEEIHVRETKNLSTTPHQATGRESPGLIQPSASPEAHHSTEAFENVGALLVHSHTMTSDSQNKVDQGPGTVLTASDVRPMSTSTPGVSPPSALQQLYETMRSAYWSYYRNQAERNKKKLNYLGHDHQNALPLHRKNGSLLFVCAVLSSLLLIIATVVMMHPRQAASFSKDHVSNDSDSGALFNNGANASLETWLPEVSTQEAPTTDSFQPSIPIIDMPQSQDEVMDEIESQEVCINLLHGVEEKVIIFLLVAAGFVFALLKTSQSSFSHPKALKQLTLTQIKQMSSNELREVCRSHGLPVSGNRKELIYRISPHKRRPRALDDTEYRQNCSGMELQMQLKSMGEAYSHKTKEELAYQCAFARAKHFDAMKRDELRDMVKRYRVGAKGLYSKKDYVNALVAAGTRIPLSPPTSD